MSSSHDASSAPGLGPRPDRYLDHGPRLAAAYDLAGYHLGLAAADTRSPAAAQQRHLERLLAGVEVHGRHIVDIGCGPGATAGLLREPRPPTAWTGVDLHLPNLLLARRRHPEPAARHLTGDGQRLPIASGCADLVLMVETAYHVPDKAALLAECHRVLRPGGTLHLADYTAEAPLPRLLAAGRSLHFWSPERYRHSLPAAGFEPLAVEDVTTEAARGATRLVLALARRPRHLWACRSVAAGLAGVSLLLRRRRLRYHLLVARRPATGVLS